jgi:colicin import membrane protein
MSSSAATKRLLPPGDHEEDRWCLGWRYVMRKLPNGKQVQDQIPLTLEDLLHPKEGDVYVENSAHERDRTYLARAFEQRLAEDERALVLSDCCIDWDVPGLRNHSPDVLVVFGIRRRRRVYRTFNVAREGVRPKLITEVVSPDSRVNDVEIKLDHYHRARVPYYIIVDRLTDESPVKVIGYRYTAKRYVRMRPDAQGRLLLPGLGLRIGGKPDRVVLYDAETGKEVGDYLAVTRALQAADAEVVRLQGRVRDLEERLRRRNGRARTEE